jgi:hypothetical protein
MNVSTPFAYGIHAGRQPRHEADAVSAGRGEATVMKLGRALVSPYRVPIRVESNQRLNQQFPGGSGSCNSHGYGDRVAGCRQSPGRDIRRRCAGGSERRPGEPESRKRGSHRKLPRHRASSRTPPPGSVASRGHTLENTAYAVTQRRVT